MRHYGLRQLPLVGLLTALCLMTSACDASPRTPAAQSTSLSPTATINRVTLFPFSSGVPAPNRLMTGPDGNLWFTASDRASGRAGIAGAVTHDAIVRMTPVGAFTVFSLPWPGTFPDGIAPGPDGNLWFTEYYGNAVVHVTPQGVFVEFLVPPRPNRSAGALPQSQPHAIAVGPDGNLWFPDQGGNKIGRITPSGTLVEFPLPAHPANPIGSEPFSIAPGPDGALWFTEQSSMRIGRTIPTGHISEFPLPGVGHVPSDIVAGADGALWFLEPNESLLGRITIDGQITEFLLPSAACHTAGIPTISSDGPCEVVTLTSGSDGALWFSEPRRNALGRMDAQDHISEYSLPKTSATPGSPGALTVGLDGAIWYAYGEGVGRFAV